MVKLRELLPRLFSKESTELVKTGAESTKAMFELGKAIKENKGTLAELQPYLKEISSLLDVLNSPWGQVLKEGIPFASLAMTLLSLGCELLKQEPTLEECVILVTQAAYLTSWQTELDQDRFSGIDLSRISGQIDRNFKKLAEIEIDRAAAIQLITALPSSDLVKQFNEVLVDRLVESGVDSAVANRFADQVAWGAPRYVNEMVAEHAEKIEVLAKVYQYGGRKVIAHYASIDDYLTHKIQPPTSPNPNRLEFDVFDEEKLKLGDIYVPLEIQPLTPEGENTSAPAKPIETWAIDKLCDPDSKGILFIQGSAGQGKSVFCRMFANLVRRELAFTPILIRLREIQTLGNNFTQTLEQHLENFEFTKNNNWLTSRNHRFLFLLDGFDELILQGRSTGGLKEFIDQLEAFQKNSHHRILMTGRPLAIQGIERLIFQNNCLERVKLLPMNETIRDKWLEKWSLMFGETKTKEFNKFLKACPTDIKDKLAREPLILYVLARIHRDGEITAVELSGTSGMAAKVKVYDKTIEWVLTKQRDYLNQKILGKLENDELRQLLTEVAVCVVQSGNEIAKLNAIEYRLTEDLNDNLKELFDKICSTASDQEKALNNLLTTFYIQAAQKDRFGSVEFAHKSFGEFLFAERIKEAICDWSSKVTIKNKQEERIDKKKFEWQMYDLLGSGCLTPDIVDYLREMLSSSTEWQPLRLFKRLNQFWEEWCDGKFIDRTENNLPQDKMKILKKQMPERETNLGIHQVDVYTGLNVLILLLELHRYAQRRNELKDLIVFYPSGEPPLVGQTTRLLKIVHYSDSIEIGLFTQSIRSYLRGADLSRANLSGANIRGADLSNANLRDADLSRADLRDANLSRADLRNANLTSAYLSSADLRNANLTGSYLKSVYFSGADLRSADLSGARLKGADLSSSYLGGAELTRADLSGADLSNADIKGVKLSGAKLKGANLDSLKWDEFTNWKEVKELKNAINIPPELMQHLGLD
jgi:Pentapeptide repeats (8 copies)/NACHT domain